MIKHFNDLGYSIVADPKSHYVEYVILKHDGYDTDNRGNITTPFFHKKGSGMYPDIVEDISNAEIAISGSVKWDGCSNWDFSSEEMNMFHGCSREDLINIGLILGEAWVWTRELIDNWNGD